MRILFRLKKALTKRKNRRADLVGMTSDDERNYFEQTARERVQGVGEIVDLGSWLGSTTISLARGLAQNPIPAARRRKIFAYDRFRWEPYMTGVFKASGGHTFQDGDSFLDEFRLRTKKWSEQIEIRAGDLCAVGWHNAPIEVLLVDVMKTIELANCVWRDFYPCLIPGTSILMHQDFAHYYCGWIHLMQYRLRDYFELMPSPTYGGTIAFRYVRPIPPEMFQTEWRLEDFDEIEIDAAFAYAQTLTTVPEKQSAIAAAHVMLYLHRQDKVRSQNWLTAYAAQRKVAGSEFARIKKWLAVQT